jgi:type III restriction enzyme
VEFLQSTGLSEDDILRVDSGRKQELGPKDWEPIRERLFDVDRHKHPKVIVSVLMLREGFDVNNICVIVPLRSSEASILLEQTIGRGLRLMWRGNDAIDELKRETRERIAKHREPTNYFDVLFIVEHPAFSRFYEELLGGDLVGEVGDEADSTDATGDLEHVDLRPGYQAYDFEVPIIIRDADEELKQPSVDPLALTPSKYQIEWLLKQIGKGDRFVSQDAQTGTQYGDYRVDGGILTATGYNDYLSRMTTRITEALGRSLTSSAGKYKEISQYPILQAYKPLLTSWLDTYVRHRMFGPDFDPLEGENWRVLLLDDVAHDMAGVFASKLTEVQETQSVAEAIIQYRLLSEVKTIPVRASASVDAKKCIYPKLPVPSKGGGLERLFIEWADQDSRIEALLKIHEYRHDFLRRPYLKADGMPAQYSPDFIVRTDVDVYVVETKAQSALSDENVKRKQRAALAWCEQLNQLPSHQRADLSWHFVLLGESIVREWHSKNVRATELLEYARLRRSDAPTQGTLL